MKTPINYLIANGRGQITMRQCTAKDPRKDLYPGFKIAGIVTDTQGKGRIIRVPATSQDATRLTNQNVAAD